MRNSVDPANWWARRRRGFSLAECLIACGIAAVGLLMIFQIYPMGFAVSNRSQARAVATCIASEILAVYRGELQRGPASEHWATGLTLRNPQAMVPRDPNSGASLFRQVSNNVGGQTAFNFPTSVATGLTLGMFYWGAIMEEVAAPQGSVTDRSLFAPMINSTLVTTTQYPAVDVDLVGARRITVFVRGPFTDATTAGQYDANRGALYSGGRYSGVSATEVVMSTIITTSRVGATLSVVGGGAGGAVGGSYIEVASVDGFSVFDLGGLYTNEICDSGAPPVPPTIPIPPSSDPVQLTTNPYPALAGGDYYGLDNVWIGSCPGDYSRERATRSWASSVPLARPTTGCTWPAPSGGTTRAVPTWPGRQGPQCVPTRRPTPIEPRPGCERSHADMIGSRRQARGLTLVETIVVIFVFSLLLVTIVSLLQGGIAAWKKGNKQTIVRAGLRKAMDEVTADLRTMVRGAPQTPGAQVLTFTFFRSISSSSTPVSTTYTIDNTTKTLQRSESGVTVVVAEDIDPGSASPYNAFFQSYDSVGSKVYVQLRSVSGASAGTTAASGEILPQMTLGTTVVCFNYQKDDSLFAYPAQRVTAPSSLEEPGRRFRRSPTALR